MTSLAQHQREILGLLRGQPDAPSAGSQRAWEAVSVVRDVALFWQQQGVIRSCPLTCRLLRRRGELDDTLTAAVLPDTPYRVELGEAFLAGLTAHRNQLVRTVATFERSLRRPEILTLVWEYDPRDVLSYLLWGDDGDPLPTPSPTRWRTVSGAQTIGRFTLEPLSLRTTTIAPESRASGSDTPGVDTTSGAVVEEPRCE